MDVEVFSTIGFGFCPPTAVETSTGGGVELIYRYVPPQLADNDERRIIGAFNEAAKKGALDDNHADRVDLTEFEPAEEFTYEGARLFARMPVYAIVRIREANVEWQAWWEGKVALTLSAEQFEPLVEEALKLPPQQLWAQKHLASVARYLYGANDPNAAAMPMAPGIAPEDLPRVAIEEKVEYPWGLWKVVLIAITDQRAAELDIDETDQFRIIPGAGGILRGGNFEYLEVPFIRWELPAGLVPNVVRWAEREQVRRAEPWAPIAVMPYFDWQSPIASIPLEPEEEVGLAAAYVVPSALTEIGTEFREWMETEIRRQVSSS